MKLDNFHAINSLYARTLIEEDTLHYDRRVARQAAPKALKPYVSGTHHLYLKQVPSCLLLRKAGSRLSKEVEPFLKEDGFFAPLTGWTGEEDHSLIESVYSDQPLPEEISSEEEEDDIPFPELPESRTNYEDPFLVLAGYAFASQYMDEKPKINVWAGGCHRLQGKIRPALCGSDRKNVTWFTQIQSHEEKMYLLFNHTHWGHRVQIARHSGGQKPVDALKTFAVTFFRRIGHFLMGKYDPIWSKPEREKFADYTQYRNGTYRAQRLLEVLKSVDGLFLQRYMAYPEEVWTWEKYDLFVLQAISILITDEFIDGELTQYSLDEVKTFYEDLKGARKQFKLVIHQDNPTLHYKSLSVPHWVESFLGATWKRAVRHESFQHAYLAGLMSQTRGSGTPPPLVILRSKRKFLLSVQEAPPTISDTHANLINVALDNAIGRIPEHIFTGLDTKARVTVTGSACWEATRAQGGTAQAILDLMAKYENLPIPIRDLETGTITEWLPKQSFESIGTAIFWACLQEVLETSPESLREVNLTIVREPGKARVVTKGRASLKIVLDTVSKICSYPLKKGFKSSESGMGKSHHGWNLFKDFTSEEMYDFLFTEDRERREEDVYASHVERLQVWEDVYLSSTDYQEATDRMVHQFARRAAAKWMKKCGIPPVLQGIVFAVCYKPRRIFFTATGPLKNIGEPVEGHQRTVRLYRGVLMGDPLTKVILHLVNIVTREIGQTLMDGTIFKSFQNGMACEEAFKSALKG